MTRFNNLMPRLIIGIGVLAACTMSNAAVIFSDNFQSDTAGQTGSALDLDPVIDTGGGDIGGSWSVLETGITMGQVINDTTPGNATAGTDNYVRVFRGTSSSTRAAVFATGWTVSDTTDQLLQIDMDVYQPSTNVFPMSFWLGDATMAPPTSNTGSGSTSINFFVANALATAPDVNTPSKNVWTHVTILANFSSTVTQGGLAPQQEAISYAGGAFGTPVAFQKPGNSVKTVLVGLSQSTNETNYFDNVVIQTVPEPAAFTLLFLGACAWYGAVGARCRLRTLQNVGGFSSS